MKDYFSILWLRIFLWIIVFQLLAGISSSVSIPGPWYDNLIKSPYTPPGYVFGLVWPFLYTTLAVFGFYLWQETIFVSEQKKLQFVFVLQMLINYAWSPVFFGFGQITAACIMIIAMVLLTGYLLYKCINYQYYIGYLLVPYLVWSVFAGYLTGYIFWFYPV